MRKIEVNLIRGQIVKRLVGALRVVKLKPLTKALSEFGAIAPCVRIVVTSDEIDHRWAIPRGIAQRWRPNNPPQN
jgi:hypothetical protein